MNAINELKKWWVRVRGMNTGGEYGFVAGGFENWQNALYGFIGGGANNTVDGRGGMVLGGEGAHAIRAGQFSHGAQMIARRGDAQFSRLVLQQQTVGTTQATMQIGNNAHTQPLIMDSLKTWLGTAYIVVREVGTSTPISGGFTIQFVAEVNVSSSSIALVGTPFITTIATDSGLLSVDIVAEVTTGGLDVKVTGLAGKTMQWVAYVDIAEVGETTA